MSLRGNLMTADDLAPLVYGLYGLLGALLLALLGTLLGGGYWLRGKLHVSESIRSSLEVCQ